jgi:hypothetical protein
MAQGLTPQEQEDLRALLRQAFQEPEAQTLLAVFERLVTRRADMVTRQDFQDLQRLMAQSVEGQRALHEAMTRLTEAQIRTEEGVGRLEEALGRLTEAQARTEERMSSLTEAQARTAQTLQQLTQAVQQLARQVGGLSETVGGDIEDIAYIVLHDVLKREFSWEVGVLERTWQSWNGEPVELNIFGQAQDPTRSDRPIWIVGEAKHNLTLREVERFARQVTQARQHLKGEVFAVCFCYRARPEVRARLQELGIRLVFSYGRMV